jgi:hypothetical protein
MRPAVAVVMIFAASAPLHFFSLIFTHFFSNFKSFSADYILVIEGQAWLGGVRMKLDASQCY